MSSTASFLSDFVNSARLISVAGCGIVTGYGFALNALCPSLLQSGIPAAHMSKVFKQAHARGAPLVLPVALTAALGYFGAAYVTWDTPPEFTTPLGLHISTQFALAGTMLVAIIPYTWFALLPGIRRMRGNVDINGEMLDEQAWTQDMELFSRRSAIRVLLFTAALVLGLTI